MKLRIVVHDAHISTASTHSPPVRDENVECDSIVDGTEASCCTLRDTRRCSLSDNFNL